MINQTQTKGGDMVVNYKELQDQATSEWQKKVHQEEQDPRERLFFYDIETFKNYFLIVGKFWHKDKFYVWENPNMVDLVNFLGKGRLIGFNNHRFR